MKNKGISLITLVITIVVVIILAAAIILTIGNNNPINQARVATVTQTDDSINSAISLYVSKIKADSMGEFSTDEILLGSIEKTTNNKIIENTTCYIEENGQEKVLYKLNKEKVKEKLNIDVKDVANNSAWYVDKLGKTYLVFDSMSDVVSYLKENDEILGTVSSFVKYKVAHRECASISYAIASISKHTGDANFTNELTNTGNGIVLYSSSDTEIATIDENGEVTLGTKDGIATITATVENTDEYIYEIKTATYTIGMNLDKISAEISFVDATVSKALGTGTYQNTLNNTGDGTVSYSSSDETIATVDNSGVVTLYKKTGVVTITATVTDTSRYAYANKTATYELTATPHVHTSSCYNYHYHTSRCNPIYHSHSYECGTTTCTGSFYKAELICSSGGSASCPNCGHTDHMGTVYRYHCSTCNADVYNGDTDVPDWGAQYTCSICRGAWFKHNQAYACGKTTSTIERYSCGYTNGQFIGYNCGF